MAKGWLWAGLIVVSGCSTPGDVASRAPVLEAGTAKDVKSYMECISPRVFADFALSKIVPIEGGQELLVSGSVVGSVIASIAVTGAGNGAMVAVRKGAATDLALQSTLANVKRCL